MCVAEYFLFQRNIYVVVLYMAQFVMCQRWTVKHGFYLHNTNFCSSTKHIKHIELLWGNVEIILQ